MYSRKIQIRLTWQHERFGPDARHCLFKVPVVRILETHVAIGPGPQHGQEVFGVFAQRPRFPEDLQKVLERFSPVGLFVEPLAVEGLAEAPACVGASKGLEADGAFGGGPFLACRGRVCCLEAFQGWSSGRESFCREQGDLDALEHRLVVDAGPGGAAEGDDDVDERRVLRGPLEGLSGAHGPAGHEAEVGDVEVLRHQGVLGAHVVVECHFGKWRDGRVGRRDGLAVSKQRRDDDEVVVRVERLVRPDEPFVVADQTAEPGRVDNRWLGGRAEGLVRYEGSGDCFAGLQGEVAQRVG